MMLRFTGSSCRSPILAPWNLRRPEGIFGYVMNAIRERALQRRLINDIRDLSGLDAFRVELERAPFSLQDTIELAARQDVLRISRNL